MVSVVSPSEILVTWDIVPPIDQNGIITQYEVYYQPLETFGGAIGPMVEAIVPPNISVILAQLEEYVFYNISVRAFTEVGPSDYTTALLERTLEDGKYVANIYMVEPPKLMVDIFGTSLFCPLLLFGCPLIGVSFIGYSTVVECRLQNLSHVIPTLILIPDFNFSSIQGTNYHRSHGCIAN